jgi:hypothetical protein
MKKLLSLLLFIPFLGNSQTFTSKDTTITVATGITWKVSFRVENTYYSQNGVDSAQMIVFFPGAGQAGELGYAGLRVYGPLDYIDGGWDGGVVLGNGTHYPILVAVEQIGDFPCNVKGRLSTLLDALTTRFRVKTKNGKKCVHLTGLSAGGYTAKITVMQDAYTTTGPWPIANKVKSIVDVQGVKPDCESTGVGYERNIENFSRSGGRMVSFEGGNDGRDHLTVINRMNSVVGSSGIYKVLDNTTPMFGHCCWNYIYGGNGSGTNYSPLNTTLDGVNQNVYQWMLRQGDTSFTAGSGIPVASAGADQQFWFTKTATTLDASGSADDGTITGYVWSKVSGPSGGTIVSSTSVQTAITGLQRGIYFYRVTVTDNSGNTATDDVKITVDAPPALTPGSDQTITLPTSSVSLSVSATDEGSIVRYKIRKMKAPVQTVKTVAVIGSSTSVPYTGGLFPSDSGWVNLLRTNLKGLGLVDTIYNLSQTSTNVYMGMPTGYVPPAGRDNPNPGINLTAAMNKPGVDIIIVNYPTNGYDYMTLTEVMRSFRIMRDSCEARGIQIYFTTTQTREGFSPAEEAGLVVMRDSIITEFPNRHIYFYINQPGSTDTRNECDLEDGTHMNGNGHAQLFKNTMAYNIMESVVSSSSVISNPNSPTTTITGLTQGEHWFSVAAQDNDSLWSYAIIKIIVNSTGGVVAVAGPDQVTFQPFNTITLNGASLGSITSSTWTKIAGPAEGTIASASSLNTNVSNLALGVYQFKLSVTDGSTTGLDTLSVTVNAQKSMSCYQGPNVKYVLPVNAGEIYQPNLPATFPGLNPGDSLEIPAGTYTLVHLDGFSGDSCRPIHIVTGGNVIINYAGSSPMLRIYNGRFFVVHGERITINGDASYTGIGMGISALSSDWNVNSLHMNNVDVGILAKVEVNTSDIRTRHPNWFMKNANYNDVKIYRSGGEGWYQGHTWSPVPPDGWRPVAFDTIRYIRCRIDSAGWDGMQVSGANYALFDRDTVIGSGWKGISDQQFGIISGGWVKSHIINSYIENAGSSAIAILGFDSCIVENTTLKHSGFNAVGVSGNVFSTIYINDNLRSDLPNPTPSLTYRLENICIIDPSGYTGGGAAIRSTNNGGTIRAGIIRNITISDALGRTLSGTTLISSATADVISAITLGTCVVTLPFPGWPVKRHGHLLRAF